MKLLEVSITGWAPQAGSNFQVPLIKIVAPVKIEARLESVVLFQVKPISCVTTIHGDFAVSGMMWSDARIHATIGDLKVILTHGDTCIWFFCYSEKTAFHVGGRRPLFERGMHFFVDQLDDRSPLTVEEVP